MKRTTIRISTPPSFDLENTLMSHGWISLLPNQYDGEKGVFSRVDRLSSGNVVKIMISRGDHSATNEMVLGVESSEQLAINEKKEVLSKVKHMFRLDEDFSPFYDLCSQFGVSWEGLTTGKGRLLRSPTLFEDLVKVIFTTNIQWSGTKRMVWEIVDAYGKGYAGEPQRKTFPDPESITADSLAQFEEKVNLGYRSKYVHALAGQFARDEINEEEITDRSKDTTEVRQKLLSIKGIGNYAAATMLMLLGRYDDIPVDTVFRQFVSSKYFKNKEFNLQEALLIYEPWGSWKYLAYWFDMLS